MAAATTIGTTTYQRIRPYLFTVAYRMTGSAADAEDLVQDAWMRYLDAGSPSVDSLRAYLTKTVSRLALDYLKSARVQREQYVGPWLPEPVLTSEAVPGPAERAEQREAVSFAFLLLLERLSPEQRVVYVLREGFGLSYDEVAGYLGKTSAACRQVFHRAQARIAAGHQPHIQPGDMHHQVVERFLAAFETGDVARVTELLASGATWIGDGGPNRLATRRPVTGADKVARGLAGTVARYRIGHGSTYSLVDLNGATAIVIFVANELDSAILLDIDDGLVATIRSIRNPDKLRHLAASLGTRVTATDPREAALIAAGRHQASTVRSESGLLRH